MLTIEICVLSIEQIIKKKKKVSKIELKMRRIIVGKQIVGAKDFKPLGFCY